VTSESREEIRCFCPDKTLLAVIKRDSENKPYVHLRVYKSHRIFGEILFAFGEMEIRCRDCWRWHKIRIIKNDATRSLSKRSRSNLVNLERNIRHTPTAGLPDG